MTAIAGLVHGSDVWIGGDAAGVSGDGVTIRLDPKVFINKDYLIGITSSFRMRDILQYKFEPPDLPQDRSPDGLRKFLATVFVDELRCVFKLSGFSKDISGEESGGLFLLGMCGHLYEIDSDYQVGEPLDGMGAVGAGYQTCLGSLFTTAYTHFDPHYRIQLALQAAERQITSVNGPFTILKI